jgi:putative ATPase
MKDLSYGKGYKYSHHFEGHIVAQDHLPDELKGKRYYQPSDQGFEARIAERLERWRRELAAREHGKD